MKKWFFCAFAGFATAQSIDEGRRFVDELKLEQSADLRRLGRAREALAAYRQAGDLAQNKWFATLQREEQKADPGRRGRFRRWKRSARSRTPLSASKYPTSPALLYWKHNLLRARKSFPRSL
jgi:hypothetical protein